MAVIIHHKIDIDLNNTKFGNIRGHVEVVIENPFEITINQDGFEIVHPDNISFISIINKEDIISGAIYTLSGCPYFLILNKSYGKRFVLCEIENNEGMTKFIYK
ncbi:MAG: hypothetical protein GY754_28435 [bacterium]|nr:hypothetical protein [bacterium]